MLRAVLPRRCVWAEGSEGCGVRVDHYRARKTGPRHAVAVVGCVVHARGRYTLYPPGHYPYGREAAAPCSASGSVLREGGRCRPAWAVTLFRAALDAAAGLWWASDSPWEDARRRRTQGRRLEFGARLLGVHPEFDERERERIATRLGVATLKLRDAAGVWSRSWRERGAAIVVVLDALSLDAALLDRVLAAGAVSDAWPEPRRWDAGRGTWIGHRSGAAEHVARGEPRSRGPPPTTLPAAQRTDQSPSSGS